MSLSYDVQHGLTIINSNGTANNLTAAYADNLYVSPAEGMAQARLYIAYTPVQDGRILSWQVEVGPSDSDLYKTVSEKIVTGANTVSIMTKSFTGTTADTTYKLSDAVSIADKYIRISCKEDGSSNFGTVVVKLILSGR